MLDIKLGLFNQHKVTLFESCEEITAKRWKEVQKKSYESAEVGSSIQDFQRNFGKVFKFAGAKDKQSELLQELKNLNRNVFYGLAGIDLKSYEFALFVYSIDGKQCTDISDSGLEKTINRLHDLGIKQSQVESVLIDLKKKLLMS